jgi:hypothetical protein
MRWCRSSSRAWRRLALAGASVVWTGCVVVPVPQHAASPLGQAALAGRIEQAVPSGEPIAELLLRLGEPDAASLDGGQLAWRWEQVWAYFLALVPVGGGPAPAPALLPMAGALETEHALIIDVRDGRVGARRLVAAGGRLRQIGNTEGIRSWGTVTILQAETYRGEPVALATRALWSRGDIAAEVPVILVLTPSGVHLKAPGSFGPAPAELPLRFAAMADARLEQHWPLWWVAIELREGPIHWLRLPGGEGRSTVEATEDAFRRLDELRRSAASPSVPEGPPSPELPASR